MTGAALIALDERGAALARRISHALPGATVHGRAGRVAEADVVFEDTADHLRTLFRGGHPIVGVCAAGILIRALGPLVADKHAEPPVIAVAGDGTAVVPLLGGHRGANRLARAVAETLGVTAAITTASDVHLGVALDDPPPGYRIADPERCREIAAALIGGAAVRIEGEAPWLAEARLRVDPGAAHCIRVDDRAASDDPYVLQILPRRLALGVGCERGAEPAALRALVEDSLAEAGLAAGAIAGVFTLDLKADEPAVAALADHLGAPVRLFDAPALEALTPRLPNPSEAVFAAVGCHGVAEAAALAAVGEDGGLVVEKRRGAGVTCAVARAPEPIDPTVHGRARGVLDVIGIGPGGARWRTAEADTALAAAEHLVGFSLYLDLLAGAAPGAERHPFPIGAERERVHAALALASGGSRVALVCSGDPGIYALATLVFEEIEHAEDPAWARIDVRVAPGVSAMQLAAARVGAPLGHDFCAISLSDLLTPWPTIAARLRAAGSGDFVVALYNPASRARRNHLVAALEILGQSRGASTPVVVARDLGRAGETVEVATLGTLDPGIVDMRTLLLVGSTQTRVADGTVFTPRGYAGKFTGSTS